MLTTNQEMIDASSILGQKKSYKCTYKIIRKPETALSVMYTKMLTKYNYTTFHVIFKI